VFENRVLWGIFRPKKDEVTGRWRKLRNEELHNVYSPPNRIRMIKSRRMEWGEEEYIYDICDKSRGEMASRKA
jgi:hypothetical protein